MNHSNETKKYIFYYLNSINLTKDDIMVDDIAEKKYYSYMVNRGLSFSNDTILLSNEMNYRHNISSRMQYDFLRLLVRKRKRYTKWLKAEKINDLELIKEYYGYNNQRAREALSLLSKEHLDYIRFKMRKGGKTQNI